MQKRRLIQKVDTELQNSEEKKKEGSEKDRNMCNKVYTINKLYTVNWVLKKVAIDFENFFPSFSGCIEVRPFLAQTKFRQIWTTFKHPLSGPERS